MNQMLKRITEDFFSEMINVDFGEDGQEWPNEVTDNLMIKVHRGKIFIKRPEG